MSHVPSPERLVHQRVDVLTRRLIKARTGEVEGIHQARVATRRLREALPLLDSRGRRDKVARAVRRLTRALGPVRELDVSLDGLGALERSHPGLSAALDRAREVMLEDRRVAHARAVKRIDRWDPARVRKAARIPVREVVRRPVVTRTERRAALRRRAGRRAAQLHGAVDHAAGIYLPDRLHYVRIAAKKLRYALEMIQQVTGRVRTRDAGSSPPSLRSVRGQIALLTRLQDLLGRMHDHEMLILRLRAVQGALDGPRLERAGDLDAAVRVLEAECRRLHGRYMGLRVRVLDVCRRVTAPQPNRRRVSAA